MRIVYEHLIGKYARKCPLVIPSSRREDNIKYYFKEGHAVA
jgi:hypothetical protein